MESVLGSMPKSLLARSKNSYRFFDDEGKEVDWKTQRRADRCLRQAFDPVDIPTISSRAHLPKSTTLGF
jgi:hypothetical protein